MFRDCENLISAPELPAKELSEGCYENMFAGCLHMTEGPELPATTLTGYCYYQMFRNCFFLHKLKAMFKDIDCELNSLGKWLEGTAFWGDGIFIKNPESTWTRDDAKIPNTWKIENAI